MIDKVKAAVTIMLDKERHLLLDMNGMIAFQEVAGINLLNGKEVIALFKDFTPKKMRAFLWACLTHEDDSLTIEQVGKFIHAGNMGEIADRIAEAWKGAMPTGGGDKRPLARRQRRHLNG